MDWNFAVEQQPKRNTIPFRFYVEAIHDPVESEKQGRAIYVDKEMIEFRIPGTNETRVHEVTEQVSPGQDYRSLYAPEYENFRKGLPQEALTGTPLKVWPEMTPAWIKMAALAGLHTVEQVAGLSDVAVQRLGAGWTQVRLHAQQWLKNAEGGAAMVELRAENDDLRRRLEVLEKIAKEQARELGHSEELVAKLAPNLQGHPLPEEAQPKRRGRPPGSKNRPKQAEG